MEAAGADCADEAGVVLEADDALLCAAREEGGADRGHRLDDSGMDATVHDAVALVVNLGDIELEHYLIRAGGQETKAHGPDPTDGILVQDLGEVLRFRPRHPHMLTPPPWTA
jgi:hypothetical protein